MYLDAFPDSAMLSASVVALAAGWALVVPALLFELLLLELLLLPQPATPTATASMTAAALRGAFRSADRIACNLLG
ncbi:MAG: hypothetical protein DLM63_03945 [Solirubrobacterales bacterium]|nr:MAG: hypothetical protein DLM63_03945 [Solirubrobacterales bacterium]